ncbi:MAG: glutamyl-tRNA amidotransferase [[Candidatus Thermochlorobacteriaceae] bacterium GBChlB]|nr:MAG: glutamyl-tRNA amidotransferase [[Candidatus Thermochlorobacteriaceae] bacterium GBChlB]
MEYELVVGLEVHCQLNTTTKAFCGCSTEFGAPANTNVCPICLAMPGSLPVLNKRVLESAIKLGLATNSKIRKRSTFARKNYFYPDLPKGYQISQFEDPICYDGRVEFELDGKPMSVRLIRIHIEEDAGKSIHDIGTETYIDANRCGVPLLEIVSHPDIRSTKEASAYLQKLRQIVRWIGISDGNMEEGSLRCDANVSIRPKGSETFGTRTEIKNMNSFKNVENAILYEAERQKQVLESGGKIVQETRLWDVDKLETRPMRSKEEAHDYRYFPEPDLVAIEATEEFLAHIKAELPELPEVRRARFERDYKIPAYDAGVLTADRDLADYYEDVARVSGNAKAASNWVMGDVLRTLKEKMIDVKNFPIDAKRLGETIALVDKGVISNDIAKKQVFPAMMESSDAPSSIVESRGLAQVSDMGAIEQVVNEILSLNPSQLNSYKAGKKNLFGFFVGEAMKQMKGKANPQLINDILKRKLETI